MNLKYKLKLILIIALTTLSLSGCKKSEPETMTAVASVPEKTVEVTTEAVTVPETTGEQEINLEEGKTFTWEEICAMDFDLTIEEIDKKLSIDNVIYNDNGTITPNAEWFVGVKEYAGDYLSTATDKQIIMFVEFVMEYTVGEGKDSPEDIKKFIDETITSEFGGLDDLFTDFDKQPEDYLPDELKGLDEKTEEELDEIFQEMEKENFEQFVEEQQKTEQETSQPDNNTTGNQSQAEPEFNGNPEWGWDALFTEEEIKEHNERMEQAIENAPNITWTDEEYNDFIKSNQ